jgi:hypothetical protein
MPGKINTVDVKCKASKIYLTELRAEISAHRVVARHNNLRQLELICILAFINCIV